MLKNWRKGYVIPLAVLVVSVCTTVGCWHFAKKFIDANASDRFVNEAYQVHSSILNLMDSYEDLLRGAVGLFAASDSVTRQEWKSYVYSLHLKQNYPSIHGVGFVIPISPLEIQRHVDEIRAEGFPDYSIRPEGNREDYTSIVFLEPFDERNRRAFGYDMYSNSIRRAAMERARDTGEAALSGKVELVQEISQDKQAGFLLYMPVYKTPEIPETIEDRRKTFLGYVYTPFRANDVMNGLLWSVRRLRHFLALDARFSTTVFCYSQGATGIEYRSATERTTRKC